MGNFIPHTTKRDNSKNLVQGPLDPAQLSDESAILKKQVTLLKRYTDAVARRRCYDRRGDRVNVAVLYVLHDEDIPRLLEIIRLQAEALEKVSILYAEGEEYLVPVAMDEMAEACKAAELKVETLADEGDCRVWGSPKELIAN